MKWKNFLMRSVLFFFLCIIMAKILKYFNISKTTPAVHNRQHTNILYMPIAISIKDLAQTIIKHFQDKYGTPLPYNIEIPFFE